MIHEQKKVAKIIGELTLFFFTIGADKVSSEIEKGEERIKITFRSNYSPECEEDIGYLEECFHTQQRNEGIGDIYWRLAGSTDAGESSQLLLLAMMVDEYEINKFENEIELCLYKNKHS